ncbi:hypothetical protein J6590_053938 [Homalodisca vitripennis]|nr:hypothetical protein J6590_053938 [Homalodisca vitripennis]
MGSRTRPKFSDLTLLHKIMNGKIDCPALLRLSTSGCHLEPDVNFCSRLANLAHTTSFTVPSQGYSERATALQDSWTYSLIPRLPQEIGGTVSCVRFCLGGSCQYVSPEVTKRRIKEVHVRTHTVARSHQPRDRTVVKVVGMMVTSGEQLGAPCLTTRYMKGDQTTEENSRTGRTRTAYRVPTTVAEKPRRQVRHISPRIETALLTMLRMCSPKSSVDMGSQNLCTHPENTRGNHIWTWALRTIQTPQNPFHFSGCNMDSRKIKVVGKGVFRNCSTGHSVDGRKEISK